MKLSVLRRQLQVARVSGIPVRLDYRWFLVFGFTLWLLATVFAEGSRRIAPLPVWEAWLVATATTLLMFLSIFGHELSHALVGRMEGIETVEIVLHPFGGLARLSREPDNPRAEFRIALAGPTSSFFFALASLGLSAAAGALGLYTLRTVLVIVGGWNMMLALFNLLPGYPLDGGRVLRGFLWHRTGRLEEATRTAGLGGQLIAWVLIIFGAYYFFRYRDFFFTASTVLVGLFLLGAARQVTGKAPGRSLRTVADAMRAPVSIEPETLVSHFVETVLPAQRLAAIPVARAGQLHGILTLEDLKQLPRERWHLTRVRDVMRPVAPQLFVSPQTPLARAEKLLAENGAGALAVVDGAGRLVGFLLRGQLRRRAGA